MFWPQTEHFTSLGSSLSNSATRLTRMAAAGNRVAVLKLAGILAAVIVVLWWIKGFFF
jgi:blocked-early-in-transport protein 1